MKDIKFIRKMWWLLFAPLFLLACEDKMTEHYEVPDWVAGSAWEVLQEKGGYSIFLHGVELAGYKSIMDGRSILTIMAPDDDAFKVYLQAHGYSSIDEINAEELKKLIGFHLLYYSYNTDKLINFRPEGDLASEENKNKEAGLYYKFRTHSASSPSTEIDRKTGKHITVYHLERFLPVFSYRYWQTKAIDAKSNYEYFYPNSTWSGENGFNVSNASVQEYGITANNGYIYKIDRVLEPLETIYTVLEDHDEYSVFRDLYDSYSEYAYDQTLSNDYGATIGVDSLYLHSHGTSLPPIAMEWPTSSYQAVKTLASVSYSVFAPSNKALNNFFETYWAKGNYESLEDVDKLAMKHLLFQFVNVGLAVFPDQIKNGTVKNQYGVPFNFDPNKVKDRVMCVNGTFYGLDEMTNPPLFGAVMGPAFRDKDRLAYLYALDGSNMLNSYASTEASYTMLIPSDEEMTEGEFTLNYYEDGNVLQRETENGWSDIGSSALQQLVQTHTLGSEKNLKATGSHVYTSQLSFNYWFLKDGKLTCNAWYNQVLEPDYNGNPFVELTELTDDGKKWTNGRSYAYGNTNGLISLDETNGLEQKLAINSDSRYPYFAFVQLLKKANMVSGESISGLFGGRFIVFIPTEAAIKTALANNAIPGITNGALSSSGITGTINLATLQNYLRSYFISRTTNVFTDYPYIGSNFKNAVYQTLNPEVKMTYTDTGSSLNVKLNNSNKVGTVTSDYNYFPFAFSDGCFHFIDSTF